MGVAWSRNLPVPSVIHLKSQADTHVHTRNRPCASGSVAATGSATLMALSSASGDCWCWWPQGGLPCPVGRGRRHQRRRSTTATSDGEVEKRCAHCETRSMPDWRRGPTGRGTLCNVNASHSLSLSIGLNAQG